MSDAARQPLNLLWLQSGGCGGCSLSLLCAEGPDLFTALECAGINLLWHPSISEASNGEFIALLEAILAGEQRLDLLCLEGSVVCGPNGSGRFHRLAGTGKPMMSWIEQLARVAGHVVAVGSCAAYGGIPAGQPFMDEVSGLQYGNALEGGALGSDYRSLAGMPVINISGCAPHPGWIMETLGAIAFGDFGESDLDRFGRPRFYAKTLAHHGCDRNEYYEFKASAEKFSDLGCMMEHLGCKATQAVGDCNQRVWNGGGSCTHGGFSCIACTSPGFETVSGFLKTPKVAGIPVGLPLDMPKAWFVALAALSKSATPERVRKNAVSDRVTSDPQRGKGSRE